MPLLTEKIVNSLFLVQDAAEYTDMCCFLINHATSYVILKFRNLRQALTVLCLIIMPVQDRMLVNADMVFLC